MRQQLRGDRVLAVNLFILALAANLVALAILLHGAFLGRFSEHEKALAIGLTSVSVFAWGLYFHCKR